jgi:hypothetical protein
MAFLYHALWIYELPQGMASAQDPEKPIARSDQGLSTEQFERWSQPATAVK